MPLTVTDLQQFEKIMEQTTDRMTLAVESSMQAQANLICCAVNAMTEQFITTNNTMTQIGKHMETMAKDQHSSSTATSHFLREQIIKRIQTSAHYHATFRTCSPTSNHMHPNGNLWPLGLNHH